MKIILLDNNPEMISAWKNSNLAELSDLEIVEADFCEYMKDHNEDIDIIVSPANAFGLMDGGYDGAITKFFGRNLMEKVQKKILEEYGGEQIIGTSISVQIPSDREKYIIHTPTMRWPEEIIDPRVISDCMRTCLLEIMKLERRDGLDYTAIIPAFGGCAGKVPFNIIADLMYMGYRRAIEPNTEISWKIVTEIKYNINSVVKY